MDWEDNSTQQSFREEVKGFIESELPERYRRDNLGAGQWTDDRHSSD